MDNSITNKIVSVLIPLVILLVVLVPICNTFGGSGSGTYTNAGCPVSEIDIDDTDRTYTLNASDFKVGDIPMIQTLYDLEGGIDVDTAFVVKTINGAKTFVSISPMDNNEVFVAPIIKLEYNDSEGVWLVYDESGSNMPLALDIFADYSIMLFDNTSDVVAMDYYLANKTVKFDSPDDVTVRAIFSGVYDEMDMMYYYDQTLGESIGYNPEDEITVKSKPVVNISEDTLTIDGKLTWTYQGEDITADFPFVVFAPKTLEGAGQTDSGIISTLVNLIPLFVALGIILALVVPMVGKNSN